MNKTAFTAAAAGLALLTTIGSASAQSPGSGELRWWKGNLHTHSFWSDGDDFPEMIVDWYKKNGYQFLALSDHNVLSAGERWIDIVKRKVPAQTLALYRERLGAAWVQERTNLVRLKPLAEFRHLFEAPGRFLLIQSEEISDQFTENSKSKPVHINATNLRDFIKPQGGDSALDVMQRNVRAVLDQRQQTGQPMFPHLNHPNFGWAITAEDLMRVEGERFFEIYNGHPQVHNDGDAVHASTDRMWDIILTWRLAVLHLEPIFGIAVDDSHHYHHMAPNRSNSGRGWVMVRARWLTPEQIVHAMEAGDFYATSGVGLKTVLRLEDRLAIEIDPEDGVQYKTQFIGTRRGFDSAHEPVQSETGTPLPVTHRYSQEIGAILAEVAGTTPSYELKGDEIYVRAKVISSKPKANGVGKDEVETAWVQPLIAP